ncbi:ribose-5-phosphate isomerase [Terrabacter sp. NPDC080008]|uniref:ribose-5-phosphate isomerase n=1 Tax=Terrabacter sp. NPDC080008 TaxID=3155176 RepID=UPI00344F3F33
MRIHIGGDHAAYDLHQTLVTHLREAGHEVVDHGPFSYDAQDDYPVYVLRAAEAVAADDGSLGVVLGGSGNGEQIAANKVSGIRAALAYSAELASLAREHNNAQIVSIGARFTTDEVARQIVDTFVATSFTEEARHSRRLGMVSAYESTGELPALPDTDGAR